MASPTFTGTVTAGTINAGTSTITAKNTVKAFVKADINGTIFGTSFNVSSVTDVGIGQVAINYTTANSTGNVVATINSSYDQFARIDSSLAESVSVKCYGIVTEAEGNSALQDPSYYQVIVL